MARPKKNDPDLLKRHIEKLQAARRWRHNEGYDELWVRMVDLYRGRHYSKVVKEDRMLVNLAFATKNVIAPSVAINNPKFVVHARKAESADQAMIAEQVLNYLWRTHKYQDEFRLAVDDFLVVGHGWLKVGYKATKKPQIVPVKDAVDGTEEPEGIDDRDETVVGNVESEIRTFTDEDRPFIERVSPHDIFTDPDARTPKTMGWIAQRTKRRVVDVMVDERYDKAVRAKVNSRLSTRRIDDENRAVDGQPEDPAVVSYVDVWEFYDLRRNEVSTFCDNLEDGFLIPPQPIPFAFGHPFVMLRNYEVPDLFYPMGELESIEILQYELNATRTQMMNHRKRYQRKVLYNKDAFEDDGINALRDDSDNVLVPVDVQSAQTDIDKVIAPMPQMGTPPDFYNQSELIQSDIDRVSGVSDYMRGAQAEIRRTATEAAMIQDAMNARAADKLSRIEQSLAQLGQRVIQLMQQFMTGEHVIRIVGTNQNPVWLQFDVDYIQGEFDFEVEGGSTQPRNESFRRQSAMQLMEAMTPFIQIGVVDPAALARHVLQFGFDVKDPESFFAVQQPMDPMADPAAQGAVAAPPPGGAPMQMPQMAPAPTGEAESPIDGIPAELVAQLMGSTGLNPT